MNDKAFVDVPGKLRALQFSPDSKWLLATSDNRFIQIWDVATGKLTKEIKGQHPEITAFGLSANGEVMVTGGTDKSIYIWR